ncbi:alkyl hydroperoxide reductase AhpD [Mesorhizobium tianshanense]|uniref:Putative peroxidase-related enzyme n=1 Tax=Mesorhizobium tianshanense TaxID=39844 RepID=A0A562P3C2_9HYPH|nr:peroxidase-related enzyme [Mesorhizobium tianshanense]TWI38851.1 putative peroxidase-related enzyme [Mesorhizobium tianshanense]GLS38118.1 alkyl hydroperoxide reductase AhpD [Mesorhizobium tianshanense]
MSELVHTFTTTIPRWQPYVVPVDLATATDEQRAAMQVTPSGKGISPYVLTLAHDPESLAVRSPLFNLIMYGRDGLTGSERELGAVAASVVNRCVYCAAVHASRFNNLTKRTDVIEAVFADGLEATLDEHLQAIFDFSARLSTTPPEATAADAQALVDVGLNELECLDLVLSAAIFGWANRLMHTLGEPMRD